jgi:hypothetical protein
MGVTVQSSPAFGRQLAGMPSGTAALLGQRAAGLDPHDGRSGDGFKLSGGTVHLVFYGGARWLGLRSL